MFEGSSRTVASGSLYGLSQTALQPDSLIGVFWGFYRTPESERELAGQGERGRLLIPARLPHSGLCKPRKAADRRGRQRPKLGHFFNRHRGLSE